jgi:hypothetical protein
VNSMHYVHGSSIVANSLDEQLNRLDLPVAIHLFPLGSAEPCGLGFPQPLQDGFLDGAGGKRFSRTCCPALALRVEADIIRILSIPLPRVGIHHPRRAGFAIEQSAQQGQVFVPRSVRKCAQSLAKGSRANAAHVAQRFLQSTEAGYQPEARSETYAKIDLKIRLRSFVENWELRSTRVMATKPPNKNPMARIPTRKLAANLKRELRQVLRQAMALKPLRKSQSGRESRQDPSDTAADLWTIGTAPA